MNLPWDEPGGPRLIVVQEGALHVHVVGATWHVRPRQGVLIDALRVERCTVELGTRLAEFALPARLALGAHEPPARVVDPVLADRLQFMACEAARCADRRRASPLADVLLARWSDMMAAALAG